jgi:hypothetical protein
VTLNIPAPKIGNLQLDPKTRIGDFLKNGSNNFDQISEDYGDHTPKYKCIDGIFKKIAKGEMSVFSKPALSVRGI